jgi:O-antigen/teichoic acid export membrane protein
MSLAKKVAHNTLIQIIAKIISTILGLLALAFITRYLGLAGFGEYTTIITFLTFFAVIADFGLTLVTVQMISGRDGNSGAEENKILNNLFGLRLVSILLFLALAPLLISFFPYGATVKTGVTLALAAFLFPALNQILIGLFQKRLSMNRNALAEIASRVILIIGLLITKYFQLGLNGVLATTVVSAAGSFLLHYLLALKFAVIRPRFDWPIWKKIISKSWPLAITIVLNLIYLRADTLLLSLFRGANEVGLYGATYKIIDVLTTIPFMFAGLILPILTAAWSENNHPYFKKVLQRSFDFMALTAIPLVIGAQFLGRPIMSFVAGRDFAASGEILQVLIFAVAAIFLGTMFSHAVIALDKQKKMIVFYVFTSLSSLIAYLILIPRFSYFGAASVTIYSEVLIAIFSAYCVFKYSRFRLDLKISLKSLASGLLMGGFLYFLPGHYQNTIGGLSVIIVLASLIYFSFLYLFGGIKKNDLEIIFKRQKKSGGQAYGLGSNLDGPNL